MINQIIFNMENITLQELIIDNNSYETDYIYSHYDGQLFPNKQIFLRISEQNCFQNEFKMIYNPVMIFELEENSEFEFDVENIINKIELIIGGCRYDILYDIHIKTLQKIYGLKIMKNNSTIFYPIPFECMLKENGIFLSELFSNELLFSIEFTSKQYVNIIKSFYIKTTKITLLKEKINQNLINCYSWIQFLNDTKNTNKFTHNSDLFLADKFKFICRTKQYYLHNEPLLNMSNIKIRLNFNFHTNKFFIYFYNHKTKTIYWNFQQFEQIKFIVNGYVILEYDYDTLLKYNSKNVLGYELPKGVFEIKWDIPEYKNLSRINNLTVELCGLLVLPESYFGIFSESVNYICYKNGCFGLALSN